MAVIGLWRPRAAADAPVRIAEKRPVSWHVRRLQDLPIQGVHTMVELRSGRWKCHNELCSRKTFPEAVAIAAPFARKTRRVVEIIRLFGHSAGGLVSERLRPSLACKPATPPLSLLLSDFNLKRLAKSFAFHFA